VCDVCMHVCMLVLPNVPCLQQKIADRKSKMLCIELDDLRDVSSSTGSSGIPCPAASHNPALHSS